MCQECPEHEASMQDKLLSIRLLNNIDAHLLANDAVFFMTSAHARSGTNLYLQYLAHTNLPLIDLFPALSVFLQLDSITHQFISTIFKPDRGSHPWCLRGPEQWNHGTLNTSGQVKTRMNLSHLND